MDEMSMTSRGGEMTLGGITFPVHDVKLEFKDKPRIPKVPLRYDGFGMDGYDLGMSVFACEDQLRELEKQKPKDAMNFDGWDAKDLVPGNWIRGLFRDYSKPFVRYEIGCGVICARPSTLQPRRDGERSLVVHFLPEGCTGWKAMELRHIWTYGPDRPKFDEATWFEPGYAAELKRICDKWARIATREIAFPFKDEELAFTKYAWPPMQNPVIQSGPMFNFTNIEPDDNIVAAEPPVWYNPMRENPCAEIELGPIRGGWDMATPTVEPAQTVAAEGSSYVNGVFYKDGVATHWHCEDCGEDNDFDQHPRRCGTCRRYKP